MNEKIAITGGVIQGLTDVRDALERLKKNKGVPGLQLEIDTLNACMGHIQAAVRRIEQSGMVNNNHQHWVVDQVLHLLLAEQYQDWVALYNADPDYDDWESGTAP